MIAAESQGRIAAFFDLDGTLLPLPSLERRFIAALRRRRAIPAGNYFRWITQAIRLTPQGVTSIAHVNKMYLHNVPVHQSALGSCSTGTPVHPEPPRASVPASQVRSASENGMPLRLPAFFHEAIDQIAWHIRCGHQIVLVTGTLAPLASEAALILTLRLIARGITTTIVVCATQLEHVSGRWTGRVHGEAIFGEAKARAVQTIAAKRGFDLTHSYAYGDSTYDRWMLGAVGRPTAVNPSRELQRIARLRKWPVLLWRENHSQLPIPATSTEKTFGIDCTVMPNTESETLG
jgi:HAD superfamily hydrolase (TIGR01490 family)